MDNHYLLLIQTPDVNLSKGMRQLNGVYSQANNCRHKRVGHLFQGRFKAVLVDSDTYLLELSRYVNESQGQALQLPPPAFVNMRLLSTQLPPCALQDRCSDVSLWCATRQDSPRRPIQRKPILKALYGS